MQKISDNIIANIAVCEDIEFAQQRGGFCCPRVLVAAKAISMGSL
jgi:hypothetical protein